MTWTVADVMSKPALVVDPSMSFKKCVDLMRIHEVSAVPVVAADRRLVGLLSEGDLVRRLDHDRAIAAPVAEDLMTRDVVSVEATASVTAAARRMIDRNVKSLPVVDAAGHVIGMISRVDVLRVFLRSDESIRREVANGILNELPLLGRGRIKVEVVDGVVLLRGDVENGPLTGLLLRLVAAVPGVVGVENHMRAPVAIDLAAPAAAHQV